MKRIRCLLVGLVAIAVTVTGCRDKPGEASAGGRITIGVGGQPLLVYLPTTLADRLGYYREEGLQVELQDLQGGSKALQALQGGSVDVASGYYDHTIQMQAKGKDAVSFVNMLRLPSLALVVSPSGTKKIDSIADLKGANVGVTAPGSSTDFFLKYLLVQHGLSAEDAKVHGIGGDSGAVAAMEQGKVDAAVMLDPSISLLQRRLGEDRVRILVDARTEQGLKRHLGVGTYPAAVLYSTQEWLTNNGDNAKKLAKAIVRTLRWIDTHSAEEIADRMPAEYAAGNREVYVQAIERTKESYSKDGRLSEEGARAVHGVLAKFNPEVANANIDLARTYRNDYLPPNP